MSDSHHQSAGLFSVVSCMTASMSRLLSSYQTVITATFSVLLQVVSAYGHEPVATTSLLAYVLCHELHDSLEDKVAWLGILGTFGDLGSSVKWDPPFPDMGSAIKQHGGKTKYSQAVSLLNARKSQTVSLSICCNSDAVGVTCWSALSGGILCS